MVLFMFMVLGNLGEVGVRIVSGDIGIFGSMCVLMYVVVVFVFDDGQMQKLKLWQCVWWSLIFILCYNCDRDVQQICFYYDVLDEFYQIWLDLLQVYFCVYFCELDMILVQVQVVKLDYICCKLDLYLGECFVDIGVGWGGLLLYVVEYYGVDVIGIMLLQNQFNYVLWLIQIKGFVDCVWIQLCDYCDL